KKINLELKNYGNGVNKKPQVICANKMDIGDAAKNLKRFKSLVRKPVYPISALEGKGLEELVDAVAKKL
ncbi:MAG: GTPase ObgE, partial [Candidatus Omnitrophica bacterium]|nr:GTPase ObgE [Candidatus Omnitrophota bacterium]